MTYAFVRDGCSKTQAVLDILRFVYRERLKTTYVHVPKHWDQDRAYQAWLHALTTEPRHLVLIGLPLEVESLKAVCRANHTVTYLCCSGYCSNDLWSRSVDATNLQSIVRLNRDWYQDVWQHYLTNEQYPQFSQFIHRRNRQGVLF